MSRREEEKQKGKRGSNQPFGKEAPRSQGLAADPGGGRPPQGINGLKELHLNHEATLPKPGENRKILVVTTATTFTGEVTDYAVNLAERLGYDLVALNVGAAPGPSAAFLSPYGRFLQEQFKRRAARGAARLKHEAEQKGLQFSHLVKFGDLSKAVEGLNREIRRIEFVINAARHQEDEVAPEVTLPVFTIKGEQGERIMTEAGSNRMSAVRKTIAYGIGAAALYAAVFTNSGAVMSYFTRGGWYAALPIATVFVFSLVHGAFANYLWSALGIEAPRKVTQPRPEAKRPVRRQRPRPRLRLNV